MHKNNEPIKLNSFYLSVFLLAKGEILIDVEKESYNKAIFVFSSSDEIKNLIRAFNFPKEGDPELLVDFKKTEAAIKQLKALIYD